ncbi:MAG TPA: polysaccharide deacetylase family protein [Anaerolineae bacterium]|nr:polysaccharide deacetylase family protein [Anaerolineae bacterium]
MTQRTPPGTIQVDVDELWVYYESIGQAAPADLVARVYEEGIPRLLALFAAYGIRATFFVCGRDLPAQASTLLEMVRQGHEVANHTTWHRTGFARLSREEKRADIATTDVLIKAACGQAPLGFKSPGFSFAADQLDVLAELGYQYDSSILPTPYAPLLRSLQAALSGGHVDPSHYGRAIHGLAPLRPYHPDPTAPHRRSRPINQSTNSSIHQFTNSPINNFLEAPITTMPLLRLPMHSTFVLTAGQALFDAGLALAKARGVPINYLLHAADVLDAVADPPLASYRFLATPWSKKQALYEHMLHRLSKEYEIMPTAELLSSLPAAG